MDHDIILELFGPEYLELDSEYLSKISLQRIQIEPILPINDKEQLKAQARYEREATAKQTKYSLEPTFQIPDTIRAIPINPIESQDDKPTRTIISTSPAPGELQPKMSNKKRRNEQYKQTRKYIRQQRRKDTINKQPHRN